MGIVELSQREFVRELLTSAHQSIIAARDLAKTMELSDFHRGVLRIGLTSVLLILSDVSRQLLEDK
jgi:hypothetical protein